VILLAGALAGERPYRASAERTVGVTVPAAMTTKGTTMANINTHAVQFGVDVLHNFRMMDGETPLTGLDLSDIELDIVTPGGTSFVTYSLVASSPSASEKIGVELGNGWYRANLGKFYEDGEVLVVTYDAQNTERVEMQNDTYTFQRNSRISVGCAYDPVADMLHLSASLESPTGVSVSPEPSSSSFIVYEVEEFNELFTIGGGALKGGGRTMYNTKAAPGLSGGKMFLVYALVTDQVGSGHEGFAHFVMPYELSP